MQPNQGAYIHNWEEGAKMHVKYRKILYNLANISSLHELYGTILMEYFFSIPTIPLLEFY